MPAANQVQVLKSNKPKCLERYKEIESCPLKKEDFVYIVAAAGSKTGISILAFLDICNASASSWTAFDATINKVSPHSWRRYTTFNEP